MVGSASSDCELGLQPENVEIAELAAMVEGMNSKGGNKSN